MFDGVDDIHDEVVDSDETEVEEDSAPEIERNGYK